MDTIVALATAFGRSGIGVVRLSGPDSLNIARQLTGSIELELQPRRATLLEIRDRETVLDEAIFTYFKSPNSFTGEDVVEIAAHGSPVILRQIIDLCLHFDARMAEPGEFSLRALANGRMNLSQAEAIRDLIDAQTVAAARQSVRQLQGELSNRLQPLKDELLDVIVVLESSLEFVEDDLPDIQNEQIKSKLRSIAERARAFGATFQAGRLLREGLKVALVGRPNVGKSSLFNALLGHERAIVTEIAGTTRDQLHEKLVIDNIPISLIDTAGLRDTEDTVESIGVERSRLTMADADLVILMLDATVGFTPEDEEIWQSIEELNHLIVVNKMDLGIEPNIQSQIANHRSQIIVVSAKTGENLAGLERSIVDPFRPDAIEPGSFLISDARHFDLLERTAAEIENSISLLEEKMSEEIVLIGLHNAIRYLGQITGETTTEDMLTRIFSTFCIGK
ncbi:MAG: tRNA uridine-5-carboxymethylaminomethyl(34) synthesis GTPase MnmE [Acidobacteria bacterium]|nr:tRNA uridine-5-carboxymethylaminomethyl(34) synthesis GTPase MnmE [Acidobacteriota bacterium]MBK8147288.1 tRNA uridine-5-carboxymethylaminomethyl(34) synthesis GTPase MnmE [Acidobacteriota bacterium]